MNSWSPRKTYKSSRRLSSSGELLDFEDKDKYKKLRETVAKEIEKEYISTLKSTTYENSDSGERPDQKTIGYVNSPSKVLTPANNGELDIISQYDNLIQLSNSSTERKKLTKRASRLRSLCGTNGDNNLLYNIQKRLKAASPSVASLVPFSASKFKNSSTIGLDDESSSSMKGKVANRKSESSLEDYRGEEEPSKSKTSLGVDRQLPILNEEEEEEPNDHKGKKSSIYKDSNEAFETGSRTIHHNNIVSVYNNVKEKRKDKDELSYIMTENQPEILQEADFALMETNRLKRSLIEILIYIFVGTVLGALTTNIFSDLFKIHNL